MDAGIENRVKTRRIRIVRGATALLIVGVATAIAVPMIISNQHEIERAACVDTMKKIGRALAMYPNADKNELYPPLSPRLGCLGPNPGSAIGFDKASSELKSWIAPGVLYEIMNNRTYYYLSYAVASDEDIITFAQAYRRSYEAGVPLTEDITNPNEPDRDKRYLLYRLREGIQRAFYVKFGVGPGNPAEDALSEARLPILIERVGNHKPIGGNVLYMDGHVEYIKYPGKWPMTQKTVGILNELDALGNP